MKSIDRLFFGVILGFAFPFLLSLLGMLIWFYLSRNESHAIYFLSTGLLLGLIIDLFYLKKWVVNRYNLSTKFLVGMYLLFNIGIYGMFMGFPVFNLLMGIVAGYYYGKRMRHSVVSLEEGGALIRRVSLVTAAIMMAICISTAVIAFTEETLAESIQQMLGLHFEVTKAMIVSISFFGGICLIILQFFVTKISIVKTVQV